jgi:hypothetical protein
MREFDLNYTQAKSSKMLKTELFSQEYTHGIVDFEFLFTDKGFYAVKCFFIGLMITAFFQILVF